ncbi:MAG: 50S ribosomal protein L1 [Candidatus Daviesbacteria bacterium]|nr:50S ribosomal protein L1 [Candidatus Daviesbacteria bacterium]
MGKTKIKTIGEEIITVIASDNSSLRSGEAGEAISNEEQIATSGRKIDPPRNDKVKQEKKSKRAQKKSEPKIRSKKYQEARTKIDPQQKYTLADAVKLAVETSITKFPGTIEAHLNTNVKNIRGLISLPHFTGKKLTILAFGQDADKSGADVIGTDEIIAQIEAGKINFDVLVTTPAWMPKLAKSAKILGPRGLMPNPKNGTISENLAKTVAELQGGKMEFKTEKDGKVIHLSVGKTNQPTEEISANIKVLFNIVGKSKISKITLSSTMGPGIKVDLSSI